MNKRKPLRIAGMSGAKFTYSKEEDEGITVWNLYYKDKLIAAAVADYCSLRVLAEKYFEGKEAFEKEKDDLCW